MDVKLLSEDELRRSVKIGRRSFQVVENAFKSLAAEGVVMPPIMRLDIAANNGEMDVKTAYIPSFPHFALKVSCGFFDNPKIGLPSLGGLMNLFDAQTGQVVAVLLDNGYLTDIRTALAGGVVAKYLAREDSKVAGVMGTGLQARLQIEALKLVRDIQRVKVWGRDYKKAQLYAEDMKVLTGIDVEVVTEPEAVVVGSDVIVTTTPSKAPIIKADWLRPGQHVTAMGADAPEKNELDPNVLLRADLFVCDKRAQSEALGELRHAIKDNILPEGFSVIELGEIVVGQAAGRENAEQITVCDLTGTGAQDTAIANYAFDRYKA